MIWVSGHVAGETVGVIVDLDAREFWPTLRDKDDQVQKFIYKGASLPLGDSCKFVVMYGTNDDVFVSDPLCIGEASESVVINDVSA